jgi:glycogen synthase
MNILKLFHHVTAKPLHHAEDKQHTKKSFPTFKPVIDELKQHIKQNSQRTKLTPKRLLPRNKVTHTPTQDASALLSTITSGPYSTKSAVKISRDILREGPNTTTLVKLYKKTKDHVSQDEAEVLFFSRIAFELRDHILRLASDRSIAPSTLLQLCEKNEVHDLSSSLQKMIKGREVLLPMVKKTDAVGIDVLGNYSLQAPLNPAKKEQKPLKVLHSSIEYEKAQVGGIGAFTKSLLSAQNHDRSKQDARIITPFYDFYLKEYPEAKFVTTIEHYYKDKMVVSSVYKVMSQNGTVPQYLIKPPLEHTELFDVETQANIYKSFPGSSLGDRFISFFSHAATAFGARHIGNGKATKPFDVFHFQSPFCCGLAPKSIHDHYNPWRKAAGLTDLSMAQSMHSTGYDDQLIYNESYARSLYQDAGLKKPKSSGQNIQALAYRYIHMAIHVSKALATLAKDEAAYGLEQFTRKKSEHKRMVGVQNGINTSAFNPTNAAILGRYAFTEDEKGDIDFKTQRKALKQELYDHGIIPDPKKPLFTFIGRFSLEKGIGTLPAMVERVLKEGGQCLIAGLLQQCKDSNTIIAQMQKLEKKYPLSLKICTDLKDQLTPFADSEVQTGKLMRLATDFALVPSHKEAGGLIPKEFWCMGTPVITSNVEGIQDNCRSLGDIHHSKTVTRSSFNAFTYKNFIFDDGSNAKPAKKAISAAMRYYRQDGKNRDYNRIRKESAVFDWHHKDGPLKEMNEAYRRACQPMSQKEQQEMKDIKYSITWINLKKAKEHTLALLGRFFRKAQRDLLSVLSSPYTLIKKVSKYFSQKQ